MVVGALSAVALVVAACSSASGSAPIPAGWTTYRYHGLAISAPAKWLFYGPKARVGCPEARDGGVVYLGATFLGTGCTGGDPDMIGATEITVQSGQGAVPVPTHSIRVNGLTVEVVNDDPGVWLVPSLNLTVSGSGPEASRVLHTVRRG